MKRMSLLLVLLMAATLAGSSQKGGERGTIRVYNYPMNPRLHPDDGRRLVKPPDISSFGNQIQFMALRSLDGDYRKLLDLYTIKYKLGNIVWPSYPVLFRNDLPDVVAELKKRGLYLFDLWGFVPGSGPGGYWQQYIVPDHVLDLFEKELGDHWLGMDNGEQDGRYVGGYASQMYPAGGSREQQYLNFQNHFQGLTDRLGNKMATLVSLNFGHYFLKEGVYTMIGAETAQGLPNTQIYYSFIRGAGKQYGVPWFGNSSVWNRWGWKNYSGVSDYNGGDTKGTSLALLKRLIYSHIMYNCSAVGFEASFLDKNDNLSPVGKIQQSANLWVQKNGNPGMLYTPVAVMLDFFSGWSFPRHLYTSDTYRVWGNLPYDEGDYLTDNILNLIYPGYQDASFFHDETGFIAGTPFGDIADCILSDCPLWLMKQYPVIIIGGRLKGGAETRDKLEKYVNEGGKLIITGGNLEALPGGLFGIRTGPVDVKFTENSPIIAGSSTLTEKQSFNACQLICPNDARVLASCQNIPLAVSIERGAGSITVLATPFGLGSQPEKTGKPREDVNMHSPYPLLSHAGYLIGNILSQLRIFDQVDGMSMITCRKEKGEYTLAIINTGWTEKSFKITSSAGKILKVKELPIDCSERKAVGFLPEVVKGDAGKNTTKTIGGGDIRIFSVKMHESRISEIPQIVATAAPVNRGLTLRDVSGLKEEILLRPTFFQHFDRVVIDWKYLADREKETLAKQSVWIRNQGLKVLVDLSSGLNLFPDLRLVENDSAEYRKSMEQITTLLEKMKALGAGDLIMTTHRTIENNFTDEEFSASIIKTLRLISREAASAGINLHLRSFPGKFASSPVQARKLQESVGETNFYIAPSLAMLAGDVENLDKNLEILKGMKYSILFISAPETDLNGKIWNLNLPLFRYGNSESMRTILKIASGKVLLLDGLYGDKEEEYLDIEKLIEYVE